MEQTTKIDIKFSIDKGFEIPQHIRIPVNSQIEWNIIDMNVNQSSKLFNENGLKFELYFQKKTPFNWIKKSTNLIYEQSSNYGSYGYQFQTKIQQLAAGIVSEKGDFKYGVKVNQINSSDLLYDEDPWLHVF
jgi:hypothetical protein